MSPAMPEPVSAYFAADLNDDVDAILACFAADAIVHDEQRTHQGAAAIRAWWIDVKAKTGYRVEPLACTDRDGASIVKARVTGDFPGSPVTLNFAFGVADGRIRQLSIRP